MSTDITLRRHAVRQESTMFHVPAHKAPLVGIPAAGQHYFDPRVALVDRIVSIIPVGDSACIVRESDIREAA